ncbi:DUF547 domain-containing protein [Aquimarina agarivorans]|uniref:DUF547 domain-containing protein n=1 Tax=Aquimarina agarivorans TaxID=980584 RepID=UPI000248F280|nr:DUF547 domain-containing protein [Aquimarina agarivorans]
MNTLKNTLITGFALLIVVSSWAQLASADVETMEVASTSEIEESISYKNLSKILRQHSSILGAVDYTAFKREYRKFDNVLQELSNTKVTNRWTQSAKVADWINVYNAYSIKLIADNFPAKRLSDIGKVEKIKFFEINNEMMSLSDIEEIIASFNDVRALLVLNRGYVGSVKMDKDAYTAENLQKTLNMRVRVFLNNTAKNKISNTSIELSPLVKKYKKEIEGEYDSIKDFLKVFTNKNITNEQKVTYLPYDDTINSFQVVF